MRWLAQTVLIESDWNLKDFNILSALASSKCINRIRLEFKVLPISWQPSKTY